MKKYLSVRSNQPLHRVLAATAVFALLFTFFFFYSDLLPTIVLADTSTPVLLTALGTASTENFDTLSSAAASGATPQGWGFAESGTNANSTYSTGTGSSNAGDTYSFGAAGSSERAFGGLLSGSLVPIVGAAYANNTGGTITSLVVGYTGEQWRLGTAGRADRLDFQYSTDATTLSTGTWTDADTLDFSSPNTAAAVGALDGNAAANRTAVSSTISGLSIPAGATFFIRWTDFNASGSDDGLAVDDFSLTPNGIPSGGPTNPSGAGNASPNSVAVGGTALLTVTAAPGSNPTSTNLTVAVNLSAIGGSQAQTFYDDGTNGDFTAGDNIFSYQATVAAGTTAGAKTLSAIVRDGQMRSGSGSISLTVTSNALSATGAANPSSLQAGGSTLLTVTVAPGVNPPSTGIAVTVDLTAIGGSATQAFYDDGAGSDAVAGNNVFSYQATVSADTTSGTKSLPAVITDAQGRTANANIGLTITTGGGGNPNHNPQEHLVMGNPSNATADVGNPFNYLLLKDQYVMSYHRDRAIPNWVSWHLDSSWIASAGRQNDFRPDGQLPADWYHVSGTSYSGSGFDRGHHTPSGDRTSTAADNSATFLMTNMMPQAPGNNQGPWEKLEGDSRTIVSQGNELYIVGAGVGTGGTGSNGFANTIDGGRITVPAYTWKVILVLPNGDNDVSRVSASTRTIAVIMPNADNIRPDAWQKYLATVDQVEALTGYDFFSNVAPATQAIIESKLDAQNNTAPTAAARSVDTAEDTAQNVTLAATDPNVNNQIAYIIVTNPAHGSLSGSGANLTYTPEANYSGSDSFTYKASDGTAESAPVTVTINVSSVNDAPIASADSKSTATNTALNFPAGDLTANDNAGAVNENTQTLMVTQVITTAQTHGQVSLNNGQITYQPDVNFSGIASFDYQVCDNGTTNGQPDVKCVVSTVSVNVGTVINYEADVSPRGEGNGAVSSTDVSVIQGFQIGIGLPYQSNEFQRADCAPFSTRGDGRVSSIDVSQAQAYQLGFNLTAQNSLQPAAGPTTPVGGGLSLWEFTDPLFSGNWTSGKQIDRTAAASREVRLLNAGGEAGQTITVPVEVDAAGDESVYGFSLSYDRSKFSNPVVSIGTAGGAVLANTTEAGRIGVSVSFGGGTIRAGGNQRLVNVQFQVAASTSSGATPLTFADRPALREVASNPAGAGGVTALPAAFVDGTITVTPTKSRKRTRLF